ncbi:MAG: hypothetical protein J0I83_03020 [Nitrobacter sp.]|nr:hypothetical protein [Nitrobacter sp.]OJV02458.1 MAG: hypothetical protein BGO16_01925 [Nitrobacter sp. 62-23]
MTIYCVFADAPEKRRSDRCNTVIVQAANEAAALTAAEQHIGASPGDLAGFAVVDLSTAPPFVVRGHPPLGGAGQSVWPSTPHAL